jgi:LexA-binding, inner membrane-associated putative hydrolase
VPVRELTGLAAAVVPMLLYTRLKDAGISHEGVLASLVIAYLVIRYGVVHLFKHVTVHRGMFHSIPAMLIAGLAVYLAYDCPAAQQSTRYVLAAGVMLGFLSHLILDEIWSVGFDGLAVKMKASAGSAVKFFSSSVWGTAVCYGMLGALGFLAYKDYQLHLGRGHTEPITIDIPWVKDLPGLGPR